MEHLSPEAQKVIADFESLPGYPGVRTPYYNNRRQKVRAALRALAGKGSPADISEEIELTALRQQVNLSKMNPDEIRAFMIDRNLGIECSGFAYYILDAESTAQKKGSLKKNRVLSNASFIRKIIATIRPVENMGVATFADEANSKEIPVSEAQPGDIIVMRISKARTYEDHILVVTGVQRTNNEVQKIEYTHSIAWPEDGKYGHGISHGSITTQGRKNLLDMIWDERGKINQANETYRRANDASSLSLRRLNWF